MTSTLLSPGIAGFLLGGGLIIAIGAQNAYLLRQGLLREHVFILCLVCALSDALLIALGVAGIGTLVQGNPFLLQTITLAGALFLFVYAILASRRALRPSAMRTGRPAGASLKQALATVLTFTFLNPHVYLDTVVLVGGISAQYQGAARLVFALGAMLASFVWFFGLGYGARWLAPLFEQPRAWQVLDIIIALVMAGLAVSLLMRLY